MKRGETFTPPIRVLLSVVAVYFVVGVLSTIGAVIGAAIPCEDYFCGLGQLFVGGAIGGLLGLIVVAVLGYLMGMRWWFIPVTIAVAVLAASMADSTDGLVSLAFVLTVFAAPVIGGLVASGLSTRALGIAFLVLTGVLVLSVGLLALLQGYNDRRDHEVRAERFRATPVALYAPTGLPEAEIRLTSADGDRVIYDLSAPDRDGWLRVVLKPAGEPHCGWDSFTDAGDGISTLGKTATDFSTVCRDFDDVSVELRPDGAAPDWTGPRILEIARELAPVDAEWLVERSR